MSKRGINTPKKTRNNDSSTMIEEKIHSSTFDKHEYLGEILEVDPNDEKKFIFNLCTRNQHQKGTRGKTS